MAADFPTNVVNLPNKSDGEKFYGVEYNKIVDEITAIETELKKPAADTIVQAADSAKLGGVAAASFLQTPAWQTWTPTLSAGGGVFTDAAAVTARYMVIGKTVFLKAIVQIITNGTAATYVKLTLPIAAQSQLKEFVAGQAVSTSNGGYLFSLGCSIFPSTDLRIFRHDGTYPGADGRTLIVSGAYEIA